MNDCLVRLTFSHRPSHYVAAVLVLANVPEDDAIIPENEPVFPCECHCVQVACNVICRPVTLPRPPPILALEKAAAATAGEAQLRARLEPAPKSADDICAEHMYAE